MYTKIIIKRNYYNFNIYTEYTHQFNQKHDLHVMGGFQAENLKQTQFGLQRDGIMFPNKPQVDLTNGLDYDGNPITPSVNGSRNDWATAGFSDVSIIVMTESICSKQISVQMAHHVSAKATSGKPFLLSLWDGMLRVNTSLNL